MRVRRGCGGGARWGLFVAGLTVGVGTAWAVATGARAEVNGATVGEGDPFTRRAVYVSLADGNHCTGVVVAELRVLTAAHCAPNAGRIEIIFADDLMPIARREIRGERRRAVNVERHPGFRAVDPLSDDLALLELDRPVPAGYVPARLPGAELAFGEGDAVVSLGYGVRNVDGFPLPDEAVDLQRRELRIAVPEPEYFLDIHLGYHRLFVRQPEGGICEGDSGGPVYRVRANEAPVLVGVNGAVVPSFSGSQPGPGRCAENAYVTRVDTALGWLRDRIGGGAARASGN